ncbi:MAG: pro-sigmaK processing inhibitor BofA family protein [Selenomonadaceae bacterium]|nr:pro-sigmaK processing inhibitor BofA family protein [Selenomonadaceae bacterium]
MVEVGAGVIAGALIIAGLIFLIKLPFKILWNSLVGGAILLFVNLTGLIAIKITFINALIVGAFGVPGFILLVIYLKFIK